jgi:hypothetical protein
MPDGLPASSYLGIADLVQPDTHSSTTMMSSNFRSEHSWMLQSPLVCTKNGARVLTIWQPKLDLRPRSLVMRMASLMVTSNISFRVRRMLSCKYCRGCNSHVFQAGKCAEQSQSAADCQQHVRCCSLERHSSSCSIMA